MCKDSDLFGDTIVLLDDVELWLDYVPKHLSSNPTARIMYAKNYDIANKIKRAKNNGSFYELQKYAESQKRGQHETKAAFHPDYFNELIMPKATKPHRLAHLLT